MKVLLPWLCVLGLGIGLGWVYSASQKKDAELASLRDESQQLQEVRAELQQLKNTRAQTENDELTRLRKQLEDLPRLRNEIGQLRQEKQQLATQVQTAQAQAQGAQQQMQALRAKPGQPAASGQPNAALQAALAARQAQAAPLSAEAQAAACINNLRLIDAAKQQWALQHQKRAGALLTATDLLPYLKSNAVPVCPAGGVYTLNPVGIAPICNIPGHTLAK
jgi:chromosome segregation ATPase